MGIPRYTDSDGPTTRPAKRGGETEIEFRQRELAWMAGQSGVGSGTVGGLGIPAPWFGSVGVTGVRLGDFGVASTANLPPPTRAGVSDAFDPDAPDRFRIDDPVPGESVSFPAEPQAPPGLPPPRASTPISLLPARFGPVGGIVHGLREARDPTPEEIERARVLAATGYDTNWGTPPGGGPGLAWSADRFLYVPDRSKASGSYAFQARDGYYLQPYRDDFGTWRTRWMYAAVSIPDVARPYRVVDAQTAGGLSTQTGDPTIDRIKSGEFREDPNAVFVPKYGPPKRAIKLSDYAWVGQKQMPVGCPYPYPAMPVPIADYTSGRWLDADYVPSIPLPPPYDQTPWQCSVPEAPGKPHKGGAPPAPMDTYRQVSEPDNTSTVTNVGVNGPGIPSATGSASPLNGQADADVPAIRDSLESTQAKEAAKKNALAQEKDPVKRKALQDEVDALKADGLVLANALQEAMAAAARAIGGNRYSNNDTLTKGGRPRISPGLLADPPKPPPVPRPGDPPIPPPAKKAKPRPRSGLRIKCRLPKKDLQLGFTGHPSGTAALLGGWGDTEMDCGNAIAGFLSNFNAGIKKLDPSIELIRDKLDPDYLILVRSGSESPLDPSQYSNDDPVRTLVSLINGTSIGTALDPRATPTEITLVNRNFSYQAPDTGKVAHVGITPAQDGADGNVKINVDALSAWQDVYDVSSPGYPNPINLAVQVAHELAEHSAGAQKSTTAGRPAAPGDIEAVANAAATKYANQLSKKAGLPVIVGPGGQDADGAPSFFVPADDQASRWETPYTLKVKYDFGKKGGVQVVEIPVDVQGVPWIKPKN